MLPWQRHIRQLNYKKVEVCVVNLLAAIFGDQRVLEEKVNETEVSKTVFSHLNKGLKISAANHLSSAEVVICQLWGCHF